MPGEPDRSQRDAAPETTDDLEEAESKSESVDERVRSDPRAEAERRVDRSDIPAPAPASYLPQGGVLAPRGEEEPGPGEKVLDQERKHRTVPKRPG